LNLLKLSQFIMEKDLKRKVRPVVKLNRKNTNVFVYFMFLHFYCCYLCRPPAFRVSLEIVSYKSMSDCWSLKLNDIWNGLPLCTARFTAFSLPGQFAPRSESANRTLANSLSGTFAPWPIRSLALSLPGTFSPGPFRSLAFSLLD